MHKIFRRLTALKSYNILPYVKQEIAGSIRSNIRMPFSKNYNLVS